MKQGLKILGVFIMMSFWSVGQVEVNKSLQKDSLNTIQVDPFNHQNKLGQAIYVFLLKFEGNGHLGHYGNGHSDQKMVKQFLSSFSDSASLPDDLSDDEFIKPPVNKKKYARLAHKKAFLAYGLIVEKKLIEATKVDSGRYKGTYKYFKLFSDVAIIGKTYWHGAIYEMELEFNADGSDIVINSIRMEEDGEFHVFKLGKFGYTSDNRLMAAYNLHKLIEEPSEGAKLKFAPPKDSSLYRVGPSFMISGGYVLPDYLSPVVYAGNINPNVSSTNTQQGWNMAAKLFFPTGKKGNFNFTVGLGYESNQYNIGYSGLQFIYKEDCLGNPLEDNEGKPYDEKYVSLSSYSEKGSLSFIQPELGVIYHINFGKKMKLSLFGSAGYSYLASSEFSNESLVSYKGKKNGIGIIDKEELGFYQDRTKVSSGEISNAFSFYKLSYGGSLDFVLKERSWLTFGFNMNMGLSPVFGTGYEFCPFLDVHVNDNFLSTFTNVMEDKTYSSMSFSVGYRYQFPKK